MGKRPGTRTLPLRPGLMEPAGVAPEKVQRAGVGRRGEKGGQAGLLGRAWGVGRPGQGREERRRPGGERQELTRLGWRM